MSARRPRTVSSHELPARSARSVRGTREAMASQHIPYTALVDPFVVATRAGDYVQTLQLAGARFECATDELVNGWHERLNVLLRNLASPQVALWTHLVRRRAQLPPESPCACGFAADLQQQYRARLASEGLFTNELYVSIVYRPLPPAAAWTWRLARRRDCSGAGLIEVTEALAQCKKLRQLLLSSLEVYGPQALGLRREGITLCSRLVEFLSLLVNGESFARPLTPAPLKDSLATTRLTFGTELMEYRTATQSRFAATLGIKEYPAETSPGLLNALLIAPFPFVLTQSFTFLSKATAQGLLQRQSHRLANAGDFALSQAQALREALDALTSNEFVLGDHHLSLQVLSDAVDLASDSSVSAEGALRGLQVSVAGARTLLAEAGIITAREDLALEAAHWAQLPGQFALRPRKGPITSRNFAALSALHGYGGGRAAGHHWGDAVAQLVTPARSVFHFNLHVQDIGHTFVCGPTGSGKTAFIAFLVAQLTRLGATQIIVDKDRGLEILVRTLGGSYLPLKSGRPTGLNPLSLPPTAQNLEFLKSWLARLTWRADRALSVAEEVDLEQALRATLELEPALRRLSRVIEFLDASLPDGVHARLAPWCEITDGERAWLFDSTGGVAFSRETASSGTLDVLAPLLERGGLVGVDVTEFLNHAETREPLTLYLFHLIRQALDGRRMVCWIDEFWRVLADPGFQRFATDGPKTWRKLNGVMALATQSPSDVLSSPLSRTIVEQTATQVFFPNVRAQWSDYGEGFGLSRREFALIRDELLPGSRRFLVRQAGMSAVCELNLSGMEDALAVLSGRATDVARVERLRAEVGEAVEQWLPAFQAERRADVDGNRADIGTQKGEGL